MELKPGELELVQKWLNSAPDDPSVVDSVSLNALCRLSTYRTTAKHFHADEGVEDVDWRKVPSPPGNNQHLFTCTVNFAKKLILRLYHPEGHQVKDFFIDLMHTELCAATTAVRRLTQSEQELKAEVQRLRQLQDDAKQAAPDALVAPAPRAAEEQIEDGVPVPREQPVATPADTQLWQQLVVINHQQAQTQQELQTMQMQMQAQQTQRLDELIKLVADSNREYVCIAAVLLPFSFAHKWEHLFTAAPPSRNKRSRDEMQSRDLWSNDLVHDVRSFLWCIRSTWPVRHDVKSDSILRDHHGHDPKLPNGCDLCDGWCVPFETIESLFCEWAADRYRRDFSIVNVCRFVEAFSSLGFVVDFKYVFTHSGERPVKESTELYIWGIRKSPSPRNH